MSNVLLSTLLNILLLGTNVSNLGKIMKGSVIRWWWVIRAVNIIAVDKQEKPL